MICHIPSPNLPAAVHAFLKYIVVTQALEDTVSIAIICAISYARRKESSLIVNSLLERSGFLCHE